MWYNNIIMETIQEIKNLLTDKQQDNLDFLYNKITSIAGKDENEMFLKSEICKLIVEICKETNISNNKYLSVILSFDLEFFKFLDKQIKLCKKNKQWEKSLDYIQKLFEYYNINDNYVYFDSIFDFYLYQCVFKTNKVEYKSSVCCYGFYNRSLVYKNLKLNDLAILDLKSCIKCSPMTITPYYELMECYIENNNSNSLKQLLNDYYKIIKTNEELSYFYYYYANYFYILNNYQMCKICCNYAGEFNTNIFFKSKIVKLLTKIYIGNNVVLDLFDYNSKELLKKYEIPSYISVDTIQYMLILYQDCLEKKIVDKQIKKYLENLIISDYKLTDYADIIYTNSKTENNAVAFDFYNFYIKIDKKWKIIYVNNKKRIKEGVILEAICNNDKISIVIDDNAKCGLEELYNQNIQILKNSGFKVENENSFYSFSGNYIKSIVVKQDNNMGMLMFFVFINNMLCLFSINFENDLKLKTKELIKIVNTITPFNSLKNKIN